MEAEAAEASNAPRRHLNRAVKDSLRALGNQLSVLNHHVGAHLELRDVDLDCLDLITRHGPLSPSALAQRAGLHPATVTGILDRLERGGWVERERDPADRRGVAVRALRTRNRELFQLYSGMNSSVDEICSDYSQSELEFLAEFLRRTTDAGRAAAEGLSGTQREDERGTESVRHARRRGARAGNS
jgi:DNA-binding MarR family transcriptional regulator